MAASGASRFLTRRQPASGLKAPTVLPHVSPDSESSTTTIQPRNAKSVVAMLPRIVTTICCPSGLWIFDGSRDSAAATATRDGIEVFSRCWKPCPLRYTYNLSSSLGPEFEKLILRFSHERNLSKELMSFFLIIYSYQIFFYLCMRILIIQQVWLFFNSLPFFFQQKHRYSWRDFVKGNIEETIIYLHDYATIFVI